MESRSLRRVTKLFQKCSYSSRTSCLGADASSPNSLLRSRRSTCVKEHGTITRRCRTSDNRTASTQTTKRAAQGSSRYTRDSSCREDDFPLTLQLLHPVWKRQQLRRVIFGGTPAFPSNRKSDSDCTFTNFSDGSIDVHVHLTRGSKELRFSWKEIGTPKNNLSTKSVWKELHTQRPNSANKQHRWLDRFNTARRGATEISFSEGSFLICKSEVLVKEHPWRQQKAATKKNILITAIANRSSTASQEYTSLTIPNRSDTTSQEDIPDHSGNNRDQRSLMTSDSSKTAPDNKSDIPPAQHRPLVVGLTKPSTSSNAMASPEAAAALNKEIEKNVKSNTKAAAPAEEPSESSQPKQKKEKAPKQPKPSKAAPAAAPTSPALIDLRVGHILRAITHPNADSLYVSTIAMGDPEGTDHTQVDEETGKVVRTVCSGLNGLIPLAEMQDRKIIVVANLKPVNMRSIKSAAMVLAASPKQEEGADPHAPDRVVELVSPPEGSEAGDKVYFEGWPYGEGKGPEKQLNPKKKQWEAIQPGFYTTDDLKVAFDASKCDEVAGSDKGNLVVEGKGLCTVKTLKDAVVR